jgi:flagellar basal body-associated protein FliL
MTGRYTFTIIPIIFIIIIIIIIVIIIIIIIIIVFFIKEDNEDIGEKECFNCDIIELIRFGELELTITIIKN